MAPRRSRAIHGRGQDPDEHARATSWARFRAAWTLRLGVDPRALATLRILLAVLILVDLLYRVPHIGAFHSDAGVLPRSALDGYWRGHTFHSLSGSVWVQGVLFLVQAVIAIALLVGYRTRLVAPLCFVLLLSLQWRNPYILNAGDLLVRVLLFWGMFLPLGARWSVDALGRETPHAHVPKVASVATAGLLLQVIIIYTLNAYHKIQGGHWAGGEALLYVFQTDRYMTPLGLALNDHPGLLAGLARAWLGLLLIAPLLLITTGRVRIVLVGLFAGAHVGMFLTMRIGLFPLACVVALLPFLPKRIWDLLEGRIARPITRSGSMARVLERIRGLRRTPVSWGSPRKHLRPSWSDGARTLGASLFLGWVLLSAGLTAGVDVLPEELQGELEAHGHRWSMFAVPGRHDTWLAVPATLDSGRTVDALHLDDAEWDEMRYVKEPFPDFRWRKYLDALTGHGREDLRVPFAAYLCDRWNDEHEDRMDSLVMHRVDQPVHLDGSDPAPVRTELGAYECG